MPGGRKKRDEITTAEAIASIVELLSTSGIERPISIRFPYSPVVGRKQPMVGPWVGRSVGTLAAAVLADDVCHAVETWSQVMGLKIWRD